ncbi:hypothetical protein FACS189494_11540 [Spirochaetia bacterium]|nr:hypothetical protein FACS189494_11540 [Spirochaetia bacterium]
MNKIFRLNHSMKNTLCKICILCVVALIFVSCETMNILSINIADSEGGRYETIAKYTVK